MVEGDYGSLVRTRPVGAWRESLAVLATFSTPEQWTDLCDALAARLKAAGMQHEALLCYICACECMAALCLVIMFSSLQLAACVGRLFACPSLLNSLAIAPLSLSLALQVLAWPTYRPLDFWAV